MDKTVENVEKDQAAHYGKIWVHDFDLNVRDSSGVRFGGKYISRKEYLKRSKERK